MKYFVCIRKLGQMIGTHYNPKGGSLGLLLELIVFPDLLLETFLARR